MKKKQSDIFSPLLKIKKEDYSVPKNQQLQFGKVKWCECGRFQIGLEWERCGICEQSLEVEKTMKTHKKK